MTDEEIRRFALQLREGARIRALMEEDAASTHGIPAAPQPLMQEEPEPKLFGEMPLLV
jgi:hypothetical protein